MKQSVHQTEQFRNDINAIVEAKKRVNALHVSLGDEISKLDKTVSNLYHILECVPLPAHKMAKVMRTLKLVLVERREKKELRIKVNNLIHHSKTLESEELSSAKRIEAYTKEALQSYKRLIEGEY